MHVVKPVAMPTNTGLGMFHEKGFHPSVSIVAEAASQEPPLLLLLLFPMIFAGFWCFVCFLLSRIGGWSRLAKRFAVDTPPAGKIFYGQSAQLSGLCNYNGCLTIIVAAEGLYLRVWALFRAGHKPILIPWAEIRNPRPRKFLWIRKVAFDAGSPASVRFSVSEKVYREFPGA